MILFLTRYGNDTMVLLFLNFIQDWINDKKPYHVTKKWPKMIEDYFGFDRKSPILQNAHLGRYTNKKGIYFKYCFAFLF